MDSVHEGISDSRCQVPPRTSHFNFMEKSNVSGRNQLAGMLKAKSYSLHSHALIETPLISLHNEKSVHIHLIIYT